MAKRAARQILSLKQELPVFKGVARNFCLFGNTVCAVLLVDQSVRLVDSFLSLLEDVSALKRCCV